MPFARPTLTDLRTQSIEDITTSGVPGLDGLLRNAVLRVLAWVMAGLAYGVYGYLDWIARQSVPFTSTDEYLQAWAALIGVYPKDATAASGQAQFTNNVTGMVLPSGSALTRFDGTPYTTTADATVDGTGTLVVPILAEVLGADTNCDDGTPISIARPITGINSGGVTLGPCVGGADQETDEELRTRMLAEYRAPPQGGAAHDYIAWALQVPGVTRAWAIPNGLGAGSVVVYPMLDDAQSAHGGFPQGTNGVASEEQRYSYPVATGDQLDVAEWIYPLQPVTALVYVAAPTALAVNATIVGLAPNTTDMVAAITASLDDMFTLTAEVAGTIYPSDLYHAILATPGIQHFTLTSPASPVVAGAGLLPILGTVTVS